MNTTEQDPSFWAEVRRFNKRHPFWFAVIFLSIILVVTQLPRVAFGAEARPAASQPGVFQPHICRPSGTPDEICLWDSPTEVAKFKSGYFDRKSGFNPNVVFDAPVKAKELIVDKITNKLDNQNTPLPASCNGSERCYAYKLYGEIVSDASCVTKGIPTNEAHTCARTPESSITEQGVINGVDVVLCGFVVAVGIFKGGAGKLVAGSGASLCVWDAWKKATIPASKR